MSCDYTTATSNETGISQHSELFTALGLPFK